jgi:4'-phosphopantetheinyl transferase
VTAKPRPAAPPADVFASGHVVCVLFSTARDLGLAGLLDTDEHARAARFVHEGARTAFVNARGVLRLTLAELVGCPPRRIELQVTSRGRPHCPQAESRGLHFSVAHEPTHGVIALFDHAVGVDLEGECSVDDIESLSQLICTARESTWVGAGGDWGQRRARFISLWTRKEALAKASGWGLTEQVLHVDTLRRTCILSDADGRARSRWWLTTRHLAPAWWMSLATNAPQRGLVLAQHAGEEIRFSEGGHSDVSI